MGGELWSFGMVTPRAPTFLGVDFGALRLGATAHVEYLWRWFGTDNFARGLGITLEIPTRGFQHPMFEER